MGQLISLKKDRSTVASSNKNIIKKAVKCDKDAISTLIDEYKEYLYKTAFLYVIDCQYKCNTLYSCCIKYLCRCLISKTLARSIIYYGNNIIKFFLIYRRKIKLFRVKLS